MAGEGSSIDDTFIDKRQAQLDAEGAARKDAALRERQEQAQSVGSVVAVQIERYLESGGYILTLTPAPAGVKEMHIGALEPKEKNEGESGVGG